LNAIEQLKAAQITFDRAKKVFEGGAGRQRDVDDAQAALELAKKMLEAATARRDLLKRVVGDVESGSNAAIPVEAPETGIIRVVSALPGQTVPAGAALFEVMDLTRVWIRVPIYVGDLDEIDGAGEARIGVLTGRPGDVTRPAKPVAAPPAASPIPGTVDLIYELDNRDTHYRPGERVGATLPLKDPAESLVVPWSAVVYDIYGGAWVYERTGDHVYSRKRVIVRYVSGDLAVLDSGPATGSKIAITGAAELFGTDAGFSK
jgi:multidrug efflux pump subunit AcrA (membrane-fusion protein)